MMTLSTKHFRDLAHYAQAELRHIANNSLGRKRDAQDRSAMLGILAASIVNADKAMCHKGMVTRASDAF